MKEGSTAWKLANFAGMQVAWFACVLGAAHDLVWAGCLAALAFIVFHFAWIRNRRPDVILAAAALLLGVVYETLNHGAGVYVVTSDLFPPPAPPAWLLLLWVVFALVIRHSMAWMRGRYVVGAVLGAVAGPLSWRGGESLGAVAFADLALPWWLTLGAEWAVAMPLLLYVAARAERADDVTPADIAAHEAAAAAAGVTSRRAE